MTSLETTIITTFIDHKNSPASSLAVTRRVRRFLDTPPPGWMIRKALRRPYFELTDYGWKWCGRWVMRQRELF
ncbi:MAG: hypothetical protein ACPGWS_00565 [Solirubrobacterales bacterium]